MADISQIDINGVSYNIKDVTARNGVAALVTDLVNYYTKSQVYNKTEINQIISGIRQFVPIVASSLPTASADTMYKLYLIPSSKPEAQNVRDEYITISTTSGGTTTYSWEQIGSTAIDLSDYSTTQEMNQAIASAIATALEDYMTSDDIVTLIEETKGDIDDELETKANKASSTPAMLVGSALGIMGNTPQAALYTHRAVPAGAGSGAAQMRLLRGRSIVWNQLVKNGDFSDGENNWARYSQTSITIAASNNKMTVTTIVDNVAGDASAITQTLPVIANHVYAVFAGYQNINNQSLTPQAEFAGVVSRVSLSEGYSIFTSPVTRSSLVLFKAIGTKALGDSWMWSNIMFIDLTALTMPDLTAPAFEALYPDFHGFNSGVIKNMTVAGLLSDGFQQWDEIWENGRYSLENGRKQASPSGTTDIRSKNMISVFPNTAYYLLKPSGKAFRVLKYGVDGTFKGYLSPTESSTGYQFTTPADVYKLTFVEYEKAAYTNDICINISNPARNGQYEPYRSYTLGINIPTLKGKAGGVGDSVTIYPDGMMSAGAAFDYGLIDADGWWRRTQGVMRYINLGNITWNKHATIEGVFSGALPFVSSLRTANTLCSKYSPSSATGVAKMEDKTLLLTNSNTAIYIKDTSYSTKEAFQEAMDGVYAIIQLATPVEYVLDTPIYMGYPVDADGTETMLPDQTGLSEPTSAPIDYDVVYPIDAAGNLVTALNAMLTANSLTGEFGEDGNGMVTYSN